MIELDDSLPEKSHSSPEQPVNTHFFADEARSGFDADMESFGAFANTKLPPPFTEFTSTNTVNSENVTEKVIQKTEQITDKEIATVADGNANFSLQEITKQEENPIRLTEEERSAAEDLVANSTVGASNSSKDFPISLTSEESVSNETRKQQAARSSVASEELKPLSEAQQLADLLAADLSTPQQAQKTSSVDAALPSEFATVVGGASTLGLGAIVINEIGDEANASNILSIPSEAEIAREQQRQLRKQELLNYQHRKKEQQKAAEQFGDRTSKSGRTVAAIVISLFLGAASFAGFFAWRNTALRTATQEAWSKLTGKPVPPVNAEVLGGIPSPNSSANTNLNTIEPAQNRPNASPTQGDSGIVPLDLTQSGSSGMTVAAQDSLNAARNLANNSSNTSLNNVSPNNTISTPSAQNALLNGNSTPASAATTNGANTKGSRISTPNENLPKTSPALASGGKSALTLVSKEQSSPASVATSGKGTQSAASKNLLTAKNEEKTLAQNAVVSEKTSSVKPVATKENLPKTVLQNVGKTNVAKPSAEKSSVAKTSPAKISTLPKSSLEKPNAAYTNNGVFAIQVYASPSQADAEDWVERLRRRGFVNPSMSSQLVRGQLLYRVRFGLYNNLRQAELDAERYGFAGAWVVRLR